MKTLIKILSIFILTFCLFSCNEDLVEQAQTGTLKGKVVKRGSNVPLANVKIFTTPTTQTVFSGADGSFEITAMPVGNYSVKQNFQDILQAFSLSTCRARISW
ncbi:carboxypeptidase regulatory-like domain-containing protein [Chryseobacterium tructae]|uniref:carboxypeptidase regulatory-like domain-containing protein n=1 Tax=Chryseobacterium tructae TaxID=1037380 RepID=UPI0025B59F87|nr:carboxypeptidase regulatory-like domain-containing protein [Chryseobacterium tructae]MDN3694543.1 carboxypeptidase regulatory-like domain-containing protein [Chryseobacterium tructae]